MKFKTSSFEILLMELKQMFFFYTSLFILLILHDTKTFDL